MAKNIYVGVNNIARKSNKIYTGVNNVSRKVTEGYIGIGGLARQFYPSGIALSTLALGARVLYGGKYYKVIAKDYYATGDVILWSQYANSNGKLTGTSRDSCITSSTPFGTANTNNVTVKYRQDSTHPPITTLSGYGWCLTAKQLGSTSSKVADTDATMSYFNTITNRRNGSNGSYWCPDYYRSGRSYYLYYCYCPSDQTSTASISTSSGSSTSNAGNYNRDFIFAYSVKGTLLCTQNSDGTYTLQI